MTFQPPRADKTLADTLTIPVVCVEEHNEALTALAWGREKGMLEAAPIRLLHVDQHADLNVPVLSRSITDVSCTVPEIKNLVETEISIATFIWAGVYLGMIKDVFWLSPPPPIPGAKPRSGQPSKRMFIATTDRERRELITMIQRPETMFVGNDDRKAMELHFASTQSVLSTGEDGQPAPWALSIDLDYFSCNTNPQNSFRIEVTQNTFREVEENNHHPLRLSLYHRVVPVHEDGGYFLEFDKYPAREADPLIRTQEQITAALADLAAMLSRQQKAPAMVVLARSRLSGFTPEGQWQFIEAGVLDMLKSLYSCDVREGTSLWS